MRKIIINCEDVEKRVVFLENDNIEEFFIERETDRKLVGSVYKGVIENVVPGIQAAFVNIGLEKNGFLHVSDILNPSEAYRDILDEELDESEEREEQGTEKQGNQRSPVVRQPQKRDQRRFNKQQSSKRASIDELVKPGQEIMVQVIKGHIGTKGVRLATHISLPGRYLVLLPSDARRGISRKIYDREERRRLRHILWGLRIPETMGLIMRTVGEGMHKKYFIRDLRYLTSLWKKIMKRNDDNESPSCLHAELDLVLRTVRDAFTDEVDKFVIDSPDEFRKIIRFVNSIFPRLRSKVELYSGVEPIFQNAGIEKEIKRIFDRKVWLKNGGYIIIEQTEALVAVDVNTGRHVGKSELEQTIIDTNLEAVDEIARQLRLRNIGGIVILDLIDMKSKRDQMRIVQRLKSALRKDRAKTNILPISEIGLVEMTRQRVQESANKAFYESCPYCHGLGNIKSITSVIIEVLREVRTISARKKVRDVKITLHPKVYDHLMMDSKSYLLQVEKSMHGHVQVEKNAELHLDEYRMSY